MMRLRNEGFVSRSDKSLRSVQSGASGSYRAEVLPEMFGRVHMYPRNCRALPMGTGGT